ncbi:DUF2157 domain-containing protein [Ulvibacter antarcticus]|uniref:Putative membrane protein n=1 Tax=Ulvibacter antarcticus TaxID=442714 RepID=A0A3L9YH24_9FLAO|nr:DUF2157 domain-containing protein [Ulvibacter antarcticus]RMA57188.1 putative membrane protein [Ulvibacter antarcticus]
MNSKLEKDLDELVEANVISSEVSSNISQYYTHKKSDSPNRLFTIFGVLGSLLVGLGIILILAHNWDDFSRSVKTIWAFIPLVVAQALSAFVLIKKKSSAWKETAATLLFFAIGASISLVSQIYNIPGSMPDFLLSWIILAAPLIYLLRSNAAAMLFMLFITVYACNVGYFNEDKPWWYLAMLLWMLPHYFGLLKAEPKANITGVFNWLMPMSILISLGAFVGDIESMGLLLYIMLFGLFYNLGKLPFFESTKLRTNGYLLLGSLGTIIVLLIASFRGVWEEFDFSRYENQDILISSLFFVAILGVLGFLFRKKKIKEFNLFQYAFFGFGIIFLINFIAPEIPAILVNILVFALGIFAVRIGSIKGMYSILNYGLLIITVLISCRFFDTDISFVIRGLLFVAIGAGFFATNYFMYRKQLQKIKKDE